jgi:hypothetical protein
METLPLLPEIWQHHILPAVYHRFPLCGAVALRRTCRFFKACVPAPPQTGLHRGSIGPAFLALYIKEAGNMGKDANTMKWSILPCLAPPCDDLIYLDFLRVLLLTTENVTLYRWHTARIPVTSAAIFYRYSLELGRDVVEKLESILNPVAAERRRQARLLSGTTLNLLK